MLHHSETMKRYLLPACLALSAALHLALLALPLKAPRVQAAYPRKMQVNIVRTTDVAPAARARQPRAGLARPERPTAAAARTLETGHMATRPTLAVPNIRHAPPASTAPSSKAPESHAGYASPAVPPLIAASAPANSASAAIETGDANTINAPSMGKSGQQPDSPPRVLVNPDPLFPAKARTNDWEGTATVRVAVDAQGRPSSVALLRSSGHAVLDQSAVDAVTRWRFAPAVRGGKPAPSIIDWPVHFKLNDDE